MSVFSRNLKKLRTKNGLSRRVLSEITGISEKTLTSYEHEDHGITAYSLDRLAVALGVTMDELYKKEI